MPNKTSIRIDNATSHPASLYDQNITITIPYYQEILEEILAFVESIEAKPASWLDTGCGTGTLVSRALSRFPDTVFTIADPLAEMLKQAEMKLSDLRVSILGQCSTENLESGTGYDIITAIQCHHYLDIPTRKQAVERCFSLLKPGGYYITSENIRPLSRAGESIGLRYWGRFQERAGKNHEEVKTHLARFDREYHPITITEHLDLYRSAGFETVEILWYSYMQGLFYAIKPGKKS
ncbi:MAG: class I SAM-dependent methyltransferase [Methanospirillum sp.]|uniref:class I SAM-dependent methyltransferase n=1 Tax=Methanospirillum sp. TaxID=45200 RepID=UPI00237574DB|nr:class I SAM-dependent methyltransferase [Methanospirillum sp.]MDD1729623.1 class I SAM-dependent methyltransferase [Methanospirillum sp.]